MCELKRPMKNYENEFKQKKTSKTVMKNRKTQ